MDTLGIKSRRSKSSRGTNQKLRDPLTEHTLESDLEDIKNYAKKYEEIEEGVRKHLDLYIFKGKSLEYYYGAYVTAYQLFVMAYMSKNEISPSIHWIIHAISNRIVETMEAMKLTK